jgi:hypothetical protein
VELSPTSFGAKGQTYEEYLSEQERTKHDEAQPEALEESPAITSLLEGLEDRAAQEEEVRQI